MNRCLKSQISTFSNGLTTFFEMTENVKKTHQGEKDYQ